MRLKGLLLMAVMVISALPFTVASQSGTEFQDPGGRFKMSLLDEWKAVTYSDAVGRAKTEFVFRDRREGLLRVTKEPLSGASLESMVKSEEENLRSYRPGFEKASTETFGGGPLRGLRFSFFNIEGGRQVAHTHYYLMEGNSVWVLRFSGRRGSLDTNRNISDQMARSFQPLR